MVTAAADPEGPGEGEDEAQHRARATEDRFLGLFEAAPDALIVVGEDGRISLVNGLAEELFGYTRAELVGEAVEVLVPERFRGNHSTHQLAYLRDPRARPMGAELQLHVRRRDGTEFAAEISLSPMRTAQGTLVTAAVRDVTERHRAEDARLRLADIVESSDDAIIGNTLAGLISSWNGGAQRLFGYSAEEMVGKPIAILVSPSRPGEEPLLLDELRERGRIDHYDTVRRRKDGRDVDVSVTISPIRDRHGELVGASKVARDITYRKHTEHALARAKEAADAANGELLQRTGELRAANEQLGLANEALSRATEAAEAANRAKSAFLANMSHEIRTPMNAILGYTQLLQRSPTLNREQRQYLDVISKSGDHLLDLINDVLEMSKIEAGFRKVNRATVDLQPLLSDIENMFRLRATEKRLSFEVNRSPEVPRYIVGDEGKLRQVLVNLLGNATKFTERGGIVLRLRVRQEAAEQWLGIEIEDTGPGITADEMGGLFQPFSQARVGIDALGGTGLGLALSREFARLMGGDITVESHVGKGSVFRFEIPVELAAPPTPSQAAPLSGRVTGIVKPSVAPTILVVDDQEWNRAWMCELLSQVGFRVREARNGAEALQVFDSFAPRVVLMDLHMPDMDGVAAIRAIRARPRGGDAVVLVVTASAFDDTREAILEAGADGWLRKPCREGQLLQEIGQLCDIQYRYVKPASRSSATMAAVRPGTEARLPPERAVELMHAAHVADYDRLSELIAAIPPEHAALAQDLQGLAERYAYEDVERRLRIHADGPADAVGNKGGGY